jgi:hypothetical protein
MEALKDAMLPPATPPPADRRDPRPLAEAIVGTWHWGLMRITFGADGGASATLPTGRSQSGRWSIGADGKLHVAEMGQDIATDAWVDGDTLTVVEDGQAIACRRVVGV